MIIFYKGISVSILFFSKWFVLFSIWAAFEQFLWSSNSSFLWQTFLCCLFFYLRHCCLSNSYVFLLLIGKIILWFSHLIHLSLVQLLFHFFLWAMVCLFRNLKCQILLQHLLQYINKYLLSLHEQWSYLYPCSYVCILTIFWFYIIILKFAHYRFTQI